MSVDAFDSPDPTSDAEAIAPPEVEPTISEQAPPIPLVAYLDALVERLLSQAAEVLATEQIEAVHQARVATRRLRAALDLVRPIVSDKSRRGMARVLRRVRRLLGPVRDIDVMIGHLDEFAPPGDESAVAPAAARWLTEEWEHDRLDAMDHARGDRTLNRLPQKLRRWQKIRARITANSDALDALIAQSLHRQADAFAATAADLAGADSGGPEAVDPHAVRIAGKALRYTVETAQAHGHPLPDHIAKSFKKMQDALGLWHDYVVLTERAMLVSAECMLAHHNLPMQAGVLTLAQHGIAAAGEQLDKFKSLWREHGPGLLDAIRGAYPAPKIGGDGGVSGSGTDHYPTRSPAPPATEGPH